MQENGSNRITDQTVSPSGSKPQFRVRQIKSLTDSGVPGFIKVYQEAFAGPPYFENYSAQWVTENILIPHLPYWVGIAETDAEGVIAFSCAHPVATDATPEATDFLFAQSADQIPFDLNTSAYGSELASLKSVRKLGVGAHLTSCLFRWAADNGYPTVVMRTAEQGSNSIRLLQRAGAKLLPFVQDVAGHGAIESQSERRVWLYIETKPFAGFDMNPSDNSAQP
jgi:hypothetical protein